MKLVIDTNVLVSSLLNPNGIPAQILNLVLAEKILLLYDNRILNEYLNVLERKKFNFSVDLIYPLLDFIKHEGLFINAEPVNRKFIDEDDKKFYEVFVSGEGDYLITGNLIHYPRNKSILNPVDFIKIAVSI